MDGAKEFFNRNEKRKITIKSMGEHKHLSSEIEICLIVEVIMKILSDKKSGDLIK